MKTEKNTFSKALNFMMLLAALFSMVSCSVEKRHYRKGYFITWHQNAPGKCKVASEKELVRSAGVRPARQTFYKEARAEGLVFADKTKQVVPRRDVTPLPVVDSPSADHSVKRSPLPIHPTERVVRGKPVSPVGPESEVPHEPGRKLKTSPWAVASFLCLFGFMIGLPVLSIFFGIAGVSQVSNFPERYKGKGLAIVGMVLGIVYVLILLIMLMMAVSAMSSIGTSLGAPAQTPTFTFAD